MDNIFPTSTSTAIDIGIRNRHLNKKWYSIAELRYETPPSPFSRPRSFIITLHSSQTFHVLKRNIRPIFFNKSTHAAPSTCRPPTSRVSIIVDLDTASRPGKGDASSRNFGARGTLYFLQQAVHQSVKRRHTRWDRMEMIRAHREGGRQRERDRESYERQRGECSRFCNSETRSSVIHDRHSPQFETRLSHARYYAWTSLTGLRWHSIKPRSGLMEFSILSIPLPLIGPMERGLKVFDETLLSIRMEDRGYERLKPLLKSITA